jgi:hypothetical protein
LGRLEFDYLEMNHSGLLADVGPETIRLLQGASEAIGQQTCQLRRDLSGRTPLLLAFECPYLVAMLLESVIE